MRRRLEPEWLDSLPPDDPRAIASRRDLARLNAVMGQAAIMARALRQLPRPRLLADLGAGDGRFLLAVARRTGWRDMRAAILDRQDIVSPATRRGFAEMGWDCTVHRGDIFETLPELEEGAVVTANLFLHHFPEGALGELLALAARRAAALVACEPRRTPLALAAAHLVGLLGCNDVTRHDAVASVRAGFAAREISALWPVRGWRCSEAPVFAFTHRFTARRDV